MPAKENAVGIAAILDSFSLLYSIVFNNTSPSVYAPQVNGRYAALLLTNFYFS